MWSASMPSIVLSAVWKERMKERGKCAMQIIGAAMRKLVHIAFGVLKSGEMFKPEMKTA
jgi:hypothetical protein